ncbi:hypothetical protein IJJ12_03725 [bacterium]|nr:hypothetical protein [bacterium]
MKPNKIVINPTHTPTVAKKSTAPILRAYYRPFFFAALPLSLLNAILAAFFYSFLPPLVPLFNALSSATDRLADKKMIFLLPAIALGINFVHALLTYFGRHYDELLLTIFNFFTIFIQALLLAVLLRNILVVI